MVNLISLEKAAKAYAHRNLLDAVSLGVSAGDRIGVVGRNGAAEIAPLMAKLTEVRVAAVAAPGRGAKAARTADSRAGVVSSGSRKNSPGWPLAEVMCRK